MGAAREEEEAREESAQAQGMNRMICLHVPHASPFFPPGTSLDPKVHSDVRLLTDWHVDELFRLDGMDMIRFPHSRLLVDVERFRNDEREPMAAVGMGAVYTRGVMHPMSPRDREDLLRRYYDPHHERLNEWARKALGEQGKALVIDCHSFNARPLPFETDQDERPDVCIGSDKFHTPAPMVDQLLSLASGMGLRVGINKPYQGTMVPSEFYHLDGRVKSIMIEINKSLYMDERAIALPKLPAFDVTRKMIRTWLLALSDLFLNSNE